MILAGDIGGTKSNIGMFDVADGKLTRVAQKRYVSAEHGGLEEIVEDFARQAGGKVTAAAFGVAGPVLNNRVHTTNLPWVVDGGSLAKRLAIDHATLLNDLEATSYGIEMMQEGDLQTLHAGTPIIPATRAVISAGTGLGESILYWDGKRHVPVPSEGGHADFAPATNQQADLWKFLRAREEFVSEEILLSGRGFQHVHEFLCPTMQHASFKEDTDVAAAEITGNALAGTCPVCVETVDLWVEIYGSEAGNLAVRAVARGGVYVAGGIAVKILPKMTTGDFVAAAQHKEKMADFLPLVPIHIVLNENCPLLGAANVAWKNYKS
jgi:glucokinase